jgi:hypothetical protein
MKVCVGGTCAESKWREKLIPLLQCDYFNPVVEDWTPECQANEEREKLVCDYHLYVITPKMQGVYSIAEVVKDSYEMTKGHCVFCITKEDDDRDWTKGELKSLDATAKLVEKNGAKICHSLDEVANYLNTFYSIDEVESMKTSLEYYKKRTEHLTKLWNRLIKEILPEGWYCMANDTWDCELEECDACIGRLHRPFVQKLIKKGKF